MKNELTKKQRTELCAAIGKCFENYAPEYHQQISAAIFQYSTRSLAGYLLFNHLCELHSDYHKDAISEITKPVFWFSVKAHADNMHEYVCRFAEGALNIWAADEGTIEAHVYGEMNLINQEVVDDSWANYATATDFNFDDVSGINDPKATYSGAWLPAGYELQSEDDDDTAEDEHSFYDEYDADDNRTGR